MLKIYQKHGRLYRAITTEADSAFDSDGCLGLIESTGDTAVIFNWIDEPIVHFRFVKTASGESKAWWISLYRRVCLGALGQQRPSHDREMCSESMSRNVSDLKVIINYMIF